MTNEWDDEGWDDDLASDEDEALSGTDADFSSDKPAKTIRSAPSADSDYDALAANAVDDPELAGFLAGHTRTVLFHRSYRYSKALPQALRDARHQAGGGCTVGVVLPLRATATSLCADMGRMLNTAVRFVDPEVHLQPPHWNEWTATAAKNWSAFVDPKTAQPDPSWIGLMLSLQAKIGATVLLTPTGKVDEAQAASSIQRAMSDAAVARSLVGAAPLFVNLTMHNAWLARRDLRTLLLNEIVDSKERHWYLRFRWPIVDPRYGQLLDPAILAGYKELASVCAAEEKILVLPNSDLTGWVATALGASGFGTATSVADRRFGDQRRIASQPNTPRPPDKLRYFSRPLLHTVEHHAHQALLSEAGYTACACPYCTNQLRPHGPPPVPWKTEAAHYHYLWNAADLTATLGSNPRIQALRQVRTAVTFLQGVSPANAPTGEDQPRHLSVWAGLLS